MNRHAFFRDFAVAVATLLPVLLCSGCTDAKGPRLADVTGRVTLDGEPVVGAGIEFVSQEPGGGVAYGKTVADGRYRMYFGQSRTGAFIGRNLVKIYSDDQVTVGGQTFEHVEVFPPQYNAKSRQFAEVVEGKNEIDFRCESGKFKPRKSSGAGT